MDLTQSQRESLYEEAFSEAALELGRLTEVYTQAAGDQAREAAISKIYDHLEKVADRFDDVANEIQGIVLENV